MFGRVQLENRKVVDMHCHILPGLDDGARFVKESIIMLKQAEKNNIKAIVATPHFKEGAPNASRKEIEKSILSVLKTAFEENIDVKLYPGNEIMYFEDVPELLENNQLYTLNNSEFVLVEFLPNHPFDYIINALCDIVDTGYVPVLAHIERYSAFLKDFDRVREIIHVGARVQINYSAVMGNISRDEKAFVHKLLKGKLVDYIGTDAHRCEGNRTVEIEEALHTLYKKYPADYIEAVTYKNAKEDFNLNI